MKVLVVSEFYPRHDDAVLGVWAHRQALAARDAGAEVRVAVLHRPLPAAADARSAAAWRRAVRQPRREVRDGLVVDYVPFVSPPRPGSYGDWGRWAAPSLAAYLRWVRRRFPFDLVHAHNAVPAGEAVRRAGLREPLVVSVHGPDVLWIPPRFGAQKVLPALRHARAVLANSFGIGRRLERMGVERVEVVHLGADLPARLPRRASAPTVTSLGHLVGRKRHGDVLRALWLLRDARPDLRYVVIGDGPERGRLRALARELEVEDRVEFTGQLDHEHALARLGEAHVMALPSVDEAFGVAYVEAMAAGIPVIGCLGEPGPQEIAFLGDGIGLVAPGDPHDLSQTIARLLDDPRAGLQARQTVERCFTWERCGAQTVAAYERVL